MRLKPLFLIMIPILFILVTCANKDDSQSDLESARDNNIDTPTPQIMTTPDTREELASSETSSIFFFVHDNTLFWWHIDTPEAPVALLENVSGQQLNGSLFAVAPDKSAVVVSTVENQTYTYYYVDAASGTATPIFVEDAPLIRGISLSPWAVNVWSPDKKWLVLTPNISSLMAYIVPVDGSQETNSLVEGFNFNKDLRWLDDNTLLVIEFAQGANGSAFPTIEHLEHINPATRQSTDIFGQLDLTSLSSINVFEEYETALNEMLLNAVGATIVESDRPLFMTASLGTPISARSPDNTLYIISPPEEYFTNAEARATTFCWEWTINAVEEGSENQPQPVIVESDVGWVSQLTLLSDLSLLYIRFRYPDCKSGIPIGELVQVHPDLSQDVLTNKLASAADRTSIGFDVRYIVSPDERRVVWLEPDEFGLENFLFGIDLETDEVNPVMVDGEQLTNIDSMVWLPVPDSSD